MNSKKFKDALYEHREVTDIKDLITSSAELYENNTAFLVKKKHSEPFEPITYGKFKKDIDYGGGGISLLANIIWLIFHCILRKMLTTV